MAKAKHWYVEVTLTPKQAQEGEVGALLECFRYAGMISAPTDLEGGGMRFRMYCPYRPYRPYRSSVSTEQWARMNAERMRSFTFDAQAMKVG